MTELCEWEIIGESGTLKVSLRYEPGADRAHVYVTGHQVNWQSVVGQKELAAFAMIMRTDVAAMEASRAKAAAETRVAGITRRAKSLLWWKERD